MRHQGRFGGSRPGHTSANWDRGFSLAGVFLPQTPYLNQAKVPGQQAQSRQYPNESGSIRPLTATQNATRLLPDDPGLAAVVEAWPELPEAIRTGIVAMVKAAERR